MFIAAQYVQAPRSSGVQCGIDDGTQEAMPLAPEGRHVYSTRDKQTHQSPRGATCVRVIRDAWRKFNAKTRRGEDAEKSGIEPVGVGFPNPLGEETKPLRLATYRRLRTHLTRI